MVIDGLGLQSEHSCVSKKTGIYLHVAAFRRDVLLQYAENGSLGRGSPRRVQLGHDHAPDRRRDCAHGCRSPRRAGSAVSRPLQESVGVLSPRPFSQEDGRYLFESCVAQLVAKPMIRHIVRRRLRVQSGGVRIALTYARAKVSYQLVPVQAYRSRRRRSDD